MKYRQQSLLRAGVNYKINDNISVQAGYTWIETLPYGDFPLAAPGTFPEHRLHEQIILRQPIHKWVFLHRFRIEQRWLGKLRSGTGENREIDEWVYLHRFRYQFKSQFTFSKKEDKPFYGALADEIVIGAGKNPGVNIFDQNRLFLLAGYRFNKNFAIEGGYMNQTLQQGRRINDKTIMQRNNGVVITSVVNL